MQIEIRLYGDCRQLFEEAKIHQSIEHTMTIAELLDDLGENYPKFSEWQTKTNRDVIVIHNDTHVTMPETSELELSAGDVVTLTSSFVE
ncbi:MoaD/ThiS family protein [Halobellus marinus]|uniref:MoaD/ThiS family protein n=1 Tax=Halobellus TaxID=1073986 RepID=UPI0028AD8159|nr:MoaD/ThiS family protein [Halobellus sp. DFY28]